MLEAGAVAGVVGVVSAVLPGMLEPVSDGASESSPQPAMTSKVTAPNAPTVAARMTLGRYNSTPGSRSSVHEGSACSYCNGATGLQNRAEPAGRSL